MTHSDSTDMKDVLIPYLQELLPEHVRVESRRSKAPGALGLHFSDEKHHIAMDEYFHEGELWNMLESDGTGWDASGLHGLDAMVASVAMMRDPQYTANPDRIPPLKSGKRLNKYGESWCKHMANKFTNESAELVR